MYLEHFGLREAPFGITPHTEFFFAGANRGATLEALIYAIAHDEGIVEVSGEVGSGKTMLCRMLLERLPEHVETVCLATPSLSREDILHVIAGELSVEPAGPRAHQMMDALRERLLEIHAAGRRVVAMIDEAHAMPAETLEEIRLLSNLESSRHKLLHIVLFGQPELDERLAEKDMRQLKDRITHHFALEPLRRSDVGGYLAFRMRAAGYRGPDVFTPCAVRLIAWASHGLTRRINVLADKSLLAAFSGGEHRVGVRQARAAIRDARLSPMDGKRRGFFAVIVPIASVVIIVLLAVFLVLDAVPFRQTETQAAAGASATAPPGGVSARAPPGERRRTLGERIAATGEWLKNTPDTHYFIQLLSTDANNLSDVQLLVDELSARIDPRQLRVYRSRLSGSDRLGVIYGDYATRAEAEANLPELSRITPAGTPYVRAVGKLK
ncbi:MAG: AAA family ATPase [Candidatus Accumulibacter sp.]|jgi:type II secretory pathway predicted ATPase ExeA|nr:AAA family ATPase [Accumulibacter sp.]